MNNTNDSEPAQRLPEILGLEINMLERGRASGRFEVAQRHMAPNGYMHAASVIALFRCTQMLLYPKG